MSFRVKPNQNVQFRFICVAVDADRQYEADDEISWLLSELGVESVAGTGLETTVLDWMYATQWMPTIKAPEDISEEGEIFCAVSWIEPEVEGCK
jgi:hypothetical protein